jgi:hypothetical protein
MALRRLYLNDILFPHFASPDDFGVSHIVRSPHRFLRRQLEAPLDVQSLTCMPIAWVVHVALSVGQLIQVPVTTAVTSNLAP